MTEKSQARKGNQPSTVENTILNLCHALTRDETICVVNALANKYADQETAPVSGLPAAILTLAGTRTNTTFRSE